MRQAIQRAAGAVVDLLVEHSRAVGKHGDRAPLERGQLEGGADQGVAGFAGQRAIGVVSVSDAALGVAADDQVALRFEQAARAFLGFAQFPDVIGQFFDAAFQRADFSDADAAPRQHEGNDGAGAGK